MNISLSIGLMVQGGDGWLGGSYYIENLCRALLSLPPQERGQLRITMVGNEQQIARLGPLSEQVDATILLDRQPTFSFSARQRFRWKRFMHGSQTPWIDELMAKQGIDFLFPYCPQDDGPRSFCAAAWQPDFQHCEMPAMFSAAEIKDRDQALQQAQKFADKIVLISENARAHCAVHFSQALAKVRVLPFASVLDYTALLKDPLEATSHYHLPEKFLMLSNQFWRHKNHGVVLDALAVLQQRGIFPSLVCTGHTYDYRHPGHFDQLLGQVHRNNLSAQVRILGVIPRHIQLTLMSQSVAVLQPSLFEGWGTGVEDARALGCATVLSDTAIHREQNPPGSHYFKPEDPRALADVLQELWESSAGGSDPLHIREVADRQIERVRTYGRHFVTIASEPVEA